MICDSRIHTSTYHMMGNQVQDELYLVLDRNQAWRLDPDFVGSITVNPTNTGFFATFASYNKPAFIKRLDWACSHTDPLWTIWRDTKFEAFPLEDFIVKQVNGLNVPWLRFFDAKTSKLWYNSRDGTSVPMFVLYDKSTQLDGTAPYLQYGKAPTPVIKTISVRELITVS
jgi:hypothetical protein